MPSSPSSTAPLGARSPPGWAYLAKPLMNVTARSADPPTIGDTSGIDGPQGIEACGPAVEARRKPLGVSTTLAAPGLDTIEP